MHQINTPNMLHKTEEREREGEMRNHSAQETHSLSSLPSNQPPPYDVIYILRRRRRSSSSVSFISDAGENIQIIAVEGAA